MINLLALCLLSIMPNPYIDEYEVDKMEINYYYHYAHDDIELVYKPKLQFVQLIIWEWSTDIYPYESEYRREQREKRGLIRETGANVVRDFKVIHKNMNMPYYDSVRNKYVCLMTINNKTIRITSDFCTYTHSLDDRELENRDVLPSDKRKSRIFDHAVSY